jgi:FtsP/CotA-like multicopper oxidase with cupredoxin domain
VVAGEPGDWMFHCHILEHAAAGMMGVIRVE